MSSRFLLRRQVGRTAVSGARAGWTRYEQFSLPPVSTPGMNAHETVARYYDAWIAKRGDMSDVPLADDFSFTGPVASFDSAEAYRAMAREAGQALTRFAVRRQFVDGSAVCSIIDWEMAIVGVGGMTWAELRGGEKGVIVRGELIYDGEGLRRAMGS